MYAAEQVVAWHLKACLPESHSDFIMIWYIYIPVYNCSLLWSVGSLMDNRLHLREAELSL